MNGLPQGQKNQVEQETVMKLGEDSFDQLFHLCLILRGQEGRLSRE